MNSPVWVNVQVWIALAVGCAAVIDDLSRRQVSNWIPAVAFVSGLSVQILQRGWRGGASALGGAIAGGAMFLALYLLGGMGGGDIKLMTGFGAVLGTSHVLEAALWTAACGGVIAAAVIAISAMRRGRNPSGVPQRALHSIPYAPAIALGTWLSLISDAPGTRGLV